MSRILITGGAGFIGSHTTRRLLDQGKEVFVYDFFHQYIHPIQPSFLENMNYRFDVLLKGAEVVRGNTNDRDNLRRQLSKIRPDHIIHLAALPLANIAVRQTEEAFAGIIQGTINMLEILRDMDHLEKFVYASSSMVYGDFSQIPMPENGDKDPKEIYGGMKLAGEILVQVYSKRYGIPYSIVRPSAVYGPTDNNRRVLQVFIEKAFLGEPITATNPDSNYLDFTYVEDAADALSLIALSENSINDTFNITHGKGRSLAEAIQILKKHFPNLEVHEKVEKDSYRPNRGTLDIRHARERVGYTPRFDLEEGIKKYIEHMTQHNPSIASHVNLKV